MSIESPNNKTLFSSENLSRILSFIDFLSVRTKQVFILFGRYKKIVLAINSGILLVVAAILFFVIKTYYTASVSILPNYGSSAGASSSLNILSSLVGGGDGSPVEMYQILIKTESVFEDVLAQRYPLKGMKDSINLYQYYEIKEDGIVYPNSQRGLFMWGYGKLDRDVKTTYDLSLKYITISVKMTDAKLASGVVNKFVESLDEYLQTKRKSNAVYQNIYLEKRQKHIGDSLYAVEEKLKEFRLQNRGAGQSPELQLEQGRLVRNVEILQAMFIELSKQLELSKLEIVRDSPVLNVKEPANEPMSQSSFSKRTLFIITFFVQMFLTFFILFFFDDVRQLIRLIKN